MKKIIRFTFVLSLFCACAGMDTRPNKVHDGQLSFKGPDYPLVVESLAQKKTRAPASVGTAADTSKKSKTRNSKLLTYNNKMIYFLTLYSQFLNFQKISQNSNEIQICPNFHSVIVSNQEEFNRIHKQALSSSLELAATSNEEARLFPQYFLPVTIEAQRPSVWDMGQGKSKSEQQELLGQSIQVHTKKLFVELRELCEYGQSDNYYIFENLVTHIQEHGPFKANKEALEALLKTSLFSNMYLIQGLTHQAQTAQLQNSFEKEILQRLDTEWLSEYFQEIARKREQVVKR